MILKLIHDPKVLPSSVRANNGFDLSEIKGLLRQLEKLGLSWEAIETSTFSEEELLKLYLEAIRPAIYKKYQVRQVFGSKRNAGYMFGRSVPALAVYEPDKQFPSDIYPHRMGNRIVTIKAFLKGLLKKLERAQPAGERQEDKRALIERMDRIRKKIGRIGVPVAELIREGRRR